MPITTYMWLIFAVAPVIVFFCIPRKVTKGLTRAKWASVVTFLFFVGASILPNLNIVLPQALVIVAAILAGVACFVTLVGLGMEGGRLKYGAVAAGLDLFEIVVLIVVLVVETGFLGILGVV